MDQLKIILAVGTGSFIGGVCRFLLSRFVQIKMGFAFPIGTLTVNLLGCFLIGLLAAFSEKASFNAQLRVFLTTGLLGGFTTFSAFSKETITLLRDGQVAYAVIYILISVVVGLAATFFGIIAVKTILSQH